MILGEFGVSLSITLIGIGIYGLINSRNIIRILLSSEVILNSTILFVFSVSSLLGKVYDPIIFSIFAISMALIEVVVAFASIILYYRNKGSLEVD
ncbi:NADH-quinone oxidoreductase subunit NuoK [Acidianus sp. HS-5]|uniref:NADH-quinone oxidoreductase subunit NuoK n=1 Tax=Acidianus sp. HS-5 TaxID=2886040 RepID=UPI001F0267B3|nr:NADH-quinone oxidoreductase subunit NuoK [Acidianus sp. HS-5]BDC19698.1 NADH-quinone oxidoreductase subunit K [Acidianus sp. HS-5]